MLDDLPSLEKQNRILLTMMFIGSLLVGFVHNDILPNGSAVYQQSMNLVLAVGFSILVVGIVQMANVNDAINEVTADWKLPRFQKGDLHVMYGMEALVLIVIYFVVVTITYYQG